MKIKKPPQTKEELLKKLNNKFLFLDSSLTLMLNNSTEEEFIKDIIINGSNEGETYYMINMEDIKEIKIESKIVKI